MAQFADLGKHCSRPDCNQQDFLPITCDLCQKVHCRDHAAYDAHECPHKARIDKRVMICPLCDAPVRIDPDEPCELTWERHAATVECARAAAKKVADEAERGVAKDPAAAARRKLDCCPAKGCKEKLTTINSYLCKTCNQKVCMKHRFEDTHQCKEAVAAAKAKSCGYSGNGGAAPRTNNTAGGAGNTRVSCARECAARAAESRARRNVGVASLMRQFLGNTSPMGKAR